MRDTNHVDMKLDGDLNQRNLIVVVMFFRLKSHIQWRENF